MRTIKFRAWNQEDKRFATKTDFDREGLFINYSTMNDGNFEIQADCLESGLGRFIVLEFIGYKDKNNEEIHRGHIVNFKCYNEKIYKVGVIFWMDNYLCWGIKCYYNYPLGEYSFRFPFRDIEVIGNIYENPELLENE